MSERTWKLIGNGDTGQWRVVSGPRPHLQDEVVELSEEKSMTVQSKSEMKRQKALRESKSVDLKALRDKAKRAEFRTVDVIKSQTFDDDWYAYATQPMEVSGDFIASFVSEADARFFEAANPQVILAMIDQIEKLNETIEKLREQRNLWCLKWAKHEMNEYPFCKDTAKRYLKDDDAELEKARQA